MSYPYSYSKFIFLDTNILSRLCVETELYRPFFDFLSRNDLTIAISPGLFAELSQATRKHSDLDWLLTISPSAFVKTGEMLLKEEVQAYPNYRKEPLWHIRLNQFTGTKSLEEYLSSTDLAETRREQLTFAERYIGRLDKEKGNFLPSKSGKYTKEQAPEFVRMRIYQWLINQHPDFMNKFKDNISDFKFEVFLSSQIFPYVEFYKFYLGGMSPKKSDYGDFFHLSYLPYCDMAVLDKDLCEKLRQIKVHHNILEKVSIKNIDFINQLKEGS